MLKYDSYYISTLSFFKAINKSIYYLGSTFVSHKCSPNSTISGYSVSDGSDSSQASYSMLYSCECDMKPACLVYFTYISQQQQYLQICNIAAFY